MRHSVDRVGRYRLCAAPKFAGSRGRHVLHCSTAGDANGQNKTKTKFLDTKH